MRFREYLALAFRLYIGAIFIYASMNKINYTAEFAETIASYQLVPFWAVNLLAVIMPWAELICGILLITGIKSKSATAILGGMLTIFSAAIFFSLLRNIPIGCGCFSSVEETMSWTTLLRDVVWLAMSVHIYFFDSALQLDKRFLISLKDI
jgi:putative oxidoreductase